MKIFNCGTLALVTTLIITNQTFARPQYAAQRGIVSCTACHYSSTGGGPKNLFGKSVASHGLGNGPSSNQDYISGDLGFIGEHATKDIQKHPAGFAQMYAMLGGVAPIVSNTDGSNARVLINYDANGQGLITSFLRWETTSVGGLKPKYITIGRFNLPFGLLTDEHRTYVRLQTNTRYYDEAQEGVMASGDLISTIHYDLALTNWYNKGRTPGVIGVGKGFQFGIAPNLRIGFGKMFLGFSGLYYHDNNKRDPWAYSLYGAFAPTKKLSLLTEFTWAKYFNDDANSVTNHLETFVNKTTSANYYGSLSDKTSFGSLIRIEYELSRHIVLFNKNDIFVPDQSFFKDYYLASALGAKYRFNSNIDMDMRFEKTLIGRTGIKETGVVTGFDRVIMYGHMWF